MAISDVHKFGAMFESVAAVTNIIIRYNIIEKQYFQSDFEGQVGSDAELLPNLKETIVRLYTTILVHLHKVNKYFQQNKASEYITIILLRLSTADFKRAYSFECHSTRGYQRQGAYSRSI